jgi:glutamine amidotransferase-like uncharacterized protein
MPNAILYSGPGVELERDEPDGGVVCLREVAVLAGFNVRTLNIGDALTAAEVNAADLWLTPAAEVKGRNNYGRYKSNVAIAHYMADKGYTAIVKAAISSGLGYVGCCAGAFWATNDLQLLGPSVLAIETKTDYHEKIAVTAGAAASQYTMDLLDGPYFTFANGAVPGNVTVIGRYETPPNTRSDAAMLSATFGQGRVFVSGPHPEASLSWAAEAHWQDTAANVTRNRQFLADWMSRAKRV